jgi:hypothetical protein
MLVGGDREFREMSSEVAILIISSNEMILCG